VSMLNERLQILVSEEHRRRLEAEAKRRDTSVGSLVREAIDARFGAVTEEERLRAVTEIAAMKGVFLEPDELARVIDEERLAGALPAEP
jgi:threonine synthase